MTAGPAPAGLRALRDCRYAAFISYAHADDKAWFGWVTQFRNELETGLRNSAALRGVPLPPLHLSADNGPVAGLLGSELEERIAASFAMIVVVHDNYAQSDWCLKELEYFRTRFGDAGLRERLYIVAMSEPAMLSVAGGSDWNRLLPGGQQLWIPFFEERERDRPISIYETKGVVSQGFQKPYLDLRGHLVTRLKAAAALDAGAAVAVPPVGAAESPALGVPTAGIAAAASAGASAGAARPPLGAAPGAAAPGPVLLGFVPGPTAMAARAAVDRLRARAIDARLLMQDALFSDLAELATAERLVLAYDDAPLALTTMADGGHLQLQREAWLRKGRAADQLLWLDLRADPAAAAAGSAAWVVAQGLQGLTVDALADKLRPPPPAPPPVAAGARLYIESNRNERRVWETLGEQIARQWAELAREVGPGRMPALTLRTRGLPVDQIDAHPPLDDADGVVLLWGAKTADALIAQINKVENKMAPGRDAAPGIVAYLMPPQQSSEPVPAWGWQVLRFRSADADAIAVVDDERADLEHFLRKVLERRLTREPA